MADRMKFDIENAKNETIHVLETAALRYLATDVETEFKALAKEAKKLVTTLDENEREGVEDIRGQTGMLFETQKEGLPDKDLRLTQLRLALNFAKYIAGLSNDDFEAQSVSLLRSLASQKSKDTKSVA